MKVCKGCGEAKPLDEFHHSSITKDRRQGKCKSCRCKQNREWQAANRLTIRAKQRRYYRENADRIKATSRRNYLANREARLEVGREYHRCRWPAVYAARGDYYRQKSRAYYRANRDRFREYGARRRAAIGVVSAETRAWVAYLLEQPCVYCGAQTNIEIDHVVPLARGGKHDRENLAPACRPCNRSKGAKLLSEWAGA